MKSIHLAAAAAAVLAGQAISSGPEPVAEPVDQPLDGSIPDRLSVEAWSPYYNMTLAKKVDVFFNGVRQMNCIAEYCISEGWVRRYRTTALGQFVTERGEKVVSLCRGLVQVVPKGETL